MSSPLSPTLPADFSPSLPFNIFSCHFVLHSVRMISSSIAMHAITYNWGDNHWLQATLATFLISLGCLTSSYSDSVVYGRTCWFWLNKKMNSSAEMFRCQRFIDCPMANRTGVSVRSLATVCVRRYGKMCAFEISDVTLVCGGIWPETFFRWFWLIYCLCGSYCWRISFECSIEKVFGLKKLLKSFYGILS